MKALTIKQPWAGLIIEGVKDIENRSWRTNYRGRVLIHSSQSPVPMTGVPHRGFDPGSMDRLKAIFKLHPVSQGRWPDILSQYPNSAIIGEVDIIDCVQDHNSIWADVNSWHWVLAKVVKYEQPILNVKGAQSFWNYNLKTYKPW